MSLALIDAREWQNLFNQGCMAVIHNKDKYGNGGGR